jgi:putative DNA primase/helicase
VSAAVDTPPNPRLEAALAYAARGWPVVPLHTPKPDGTCDCNKKGCDAIGKHPRTRDGLKSATTDPAAIRRWWSLWPHANIGVRTGELAPGRFLAVLDVDPRAGGDDSLADLEKVHGAVGDTMLGLTGGGGRHFVFEGEAPIKTTSGGLGPGLDTRGGGGRFGAGYIVAPPSLHASGRAYAWDVGAPETPTTPPAWLVALANGPAVPAPASGAADAGDRIVDGQAGGPGRKKTLHSIGRTMRARGLDAEEIFAALAAINARRCEPPLDEKDVRRVAEHAARVAPGRSEEYEQKAQRRLRVVAPGEDGGPGDAPPPAPPGRRGGLVRGDAVELGARLLEDLRAGSSVPLVYDRNEFWRYDDAAGIYRAVREADAFRAVAAYAGAPIGKKTLSLSESAVGGAVKMARQFASSLGGYFNAAPEGIAFANGFVVLEGGRAVLRPHSPDHRAQFALPFAYDPAAPAPRWHRYLAEVFTYPNEEHAEPDDRALLAEDREARIRLLQEHAGACLIGRAVQHAVCLVLTGEGANGKSVYLTVIKALFPRGATASIAPQLWENRFYLAELAGVRLNAVSEMPESEMADSGPFKTVVAGEEITVARKHQHPFELLPVAGHLFACNALPSTRDLSEGFWRRFAVVAFDRTFADHERELDLAARLVAEELPGIAAWVVAGAAALAARGRFVLPASSEHVKDEWQRSADQVRQFIEECTTAGGRMNPSRAYEAYAVWTRRTGHGALTRGKFWRRLAKLLPQRCDGEERFYERSLRPEWAAQRDGFR